MSNNQPMQSVADSIALSHWGSIAQIVKSHPSDGLVEQQMTFARAIWQKAFEAGHAKGLEALSKTPGAACPQELMAALETTLVDRRSAFLIAEATTLIEKLVPLVKPEDLAKLLALAPVTSPQQKRRPDLRVVRKPEELA